MFTGKSAGATKPKNFEPPNPVAFLIWSKNEQ
jgi:hypothetical protein